MKRYENEILKVSKWNHEEYENEIWKVKSRQGEDHLEDNGDKDCKDISIKKLLSTFIAFFLEDADYWFANIA